jgi:hypothetical protein
MHTGWKKNGRPFSLEEYNHSYIKKNIGGNYSDYLRKMAKMRRREENQPQAKRKRAPQRSGGLFNMPRVPKFRMPRF